MNTEITNLYKELEAAKVPLNPPGTTDPTTVLKAIDMAIQTWNKRRTLKQFEAQATAKKKVLDDLKARIQADPNVIKVHAKEYAEIAKKEKQQKEKEIRDMANIYVNGQGEIAQDLLTQVAKQFGMKEAEILSILGARLKQKRTFSYKDDGVPELDAMKMREISTQLNTVKKKTLYDFLGVRPNASEADINARLEAKRREISANLNKDVVVNAESRLCGECSSILLKADERKKYDKALDNAAFAPVRVKMQTFKTAHSTLISASQYLALLSECTAAGIPKDKAEFLLFTTADTMGLAIDDSAASGEKMVQCRFCGALNEQKQGSAQQVCRSCGMPLSISCPNCGQQAGNDDLRCTKCGFDISSMPLAKQYIRMAETAIELNSANEAETNYMMAQKYWKTCPDLRTLADRINKLPPPAPTNLQAELQGNAVRLTWEKVPSRRAAYQYTVVRKENGRPTGPTDGQQIGTTANGGYDDATMQPGISYYYAVYTRNGDTLSDKAAVTAKPLMRVDDINPALLRLKVQERSIEFGYKLPAGMKAIEISRDGRLVQTLTGTSVIDSGLTPRQTYTYRLVAVYSDAAGQQVRSGGITQQLTPKPMPTPVDLKKSEGEQQAQLSWQQPQNGTLVIYYSDTRFAQNRNDVVNTGALKAEALNVSGTQCTINKDFSGERFFLPVTVEGNIGVAGQQVSIVSIAALKGVTIEQDGNGIDVSWQWKNTSAVRISYSLDGQDEKHTEISHASSTVARHRVPVPAQTKTVTVSICSVVKTGEKTLYGTPVSKTFSLQMVKVRFNEVRSKARFGLFGKDKWSLTVECDAQLPCPLHLLIQEHIPPMDLVNYRSWATISPADLQPGKPTEIEFTYERKQKGQPCHFRLVAQEASLRKQMTILPETRMVK